jgi:glucose-1-phosphate adenylyltransferase
VRRSVLGRYVRVHSNALVEDCILFDNVDIGRRARIRRAILEKNVQIPADTEIGYDLKKDRAAYQVTESGLVIIEGRRTPVSLTYVDI